MIHKKFIEKNPKKLDKESKKLKRELRAYKEESHPRGFFFTKENWHESCINSA